MLRISYINFEHGGRDSADYFGNGGPYDYTGLVEIMRVGQWPDILVVGEGDRYELNGGEGAYEAAAALRSAGSPPYVPLPCSLPRDGMFAPVLYYDPNTIQANRFYSHRLPDFADRNRNVFVASRPGARRESSFLVVPWHGDIHDGTARLADARRFDRFAKPDRPCVLVGDWNSPLGGPWEPKDLNDPAVHTPQSIAWRTHWQHGPGQQGPHRFDTRALDYLCGWWDPDRRERVGGIGFYDVAELAGDFTPTQHAHPRGREPICIDRAMVNEPWRDAYVPGSYRVFTPDHGEPHSDHSRIEFGIDA